MIKLNTEPTGLTLLGRLFACALLVWSRLPAIANQSGSMIYQIKHGMLFGLLD
jgi:hypothetical protein